MKTGIRAKVTGLFFLGAALYALSVGVAYFNTGLLVDGLRRAKEISERVKVTGELQLYLNRLLMPPNDYLITEDVAERDVFDLIIKEVSGRFDFLKELVGNERWHEVLAEATDDSIKLGDMAIDLLYTDNPVGNMAAAAGMEEMDAFAEKLIEKVRELHDISEEDIIREESLAAERAAAMLNFFAALTIAGFFTLPFFLLYLSKYLVRPVLTLYEGTVAIGEGNLSHRLPVVKSGDEFERLTAGFNSMADSLQEAKEELDRNIMELYALYNLSKVMNTTFETELLINRLITKISNSLNIQRVMIMLLDERRQEFYAASFTGFKEEGLTELKRKFGEGFYGLVAQTGMARLVKDVGEEINFPAEDRLSPDIQSIIAVPFGRRDKVVGTLCLFKDRPGTFGHNDLELFRAVAEQLAVALENARLYSETKIMAVTDGLTSLYNHRFFKERLNAELERADRYGHPLSLIIMDIDNFKHYNDNHGHQKGDDLLVELSELLRNCVRGSDIVCRYGGEEFVIIMPETTKNTVGALAERIRKAVYDHPFRYRETQPLKAISLSLGVAAAPEDGKVMDVLIKKADDALFMAKNGGRNRVAVA